MEINISRIIHGSPELPKDPPVLAAIALVKNEGDIIGLWLSHILSIFDVVYIADHQSIDGTREFLKDIASINQKINLFEFNYSGYFQSEITNQLTELVAKEYPDAWIFPLDADEFLSISNKAELRKYISKIRTDQIPRQKWKNCVPVVLSKDREVCSKTLLLASPERGDFNKVAMHSSAYNELSFRFIQGNHAISDIAGLSFDYVEFPPLIHLPIRSVDHIILKCLQGKMAYDSLPSKRIHQRQGTHWIGMLEKINELGESLPRLIRSFMTNYGTPPQSSHSGKSILDLLKNNWRFTTLEKCSRLRLPVRMKRKYKFSQLITAISKETKTEV